jgi:L-histidine N-alpha-methyltransferase
VIFRNLVQQCHHSFASGDIVELGSGANRKIRIFLDSAGKDRLPLLRYIPVDVSERALKEASEELHNIYPDLAVLGIIADFTLHMDAIPCDNPRMIMFLGSTIGNFDEKMQKHFLRLVAGSMKHDD